MDLSKRGIFRNEKGEMHYSIIFSLIIGLLVVAIVASWLFQDYFSQKEIDWNVCREALIVRNVAPEKDVGGIGVASTKSALPLECKTQPIAIDYENTTKAEQEIAETIASCWYMIGKGEYRVFPGYSSSRAVATPCMMCARISMDSDVKEYYSEEANRIDIKEALDSQLKGYDTSVWDYLNPSESEGSSAFQYFDDWDDDGFNHSFVKDWSWSGFSPSDLKVFRLPRYFIPGKGDLFVGYAEPVRQSVLSDERSINPYMILIQYDDFDQLTEYWAKLHETTDVLKNVVPIVAQYSWIKHLLGDCSNCAEVCSSIESIPA